MGGTEVVGATVVAGTEVVTGIGAGAAGAGAALAAGNLSFWPTLIWSVFNPFKLRTDFAVVPCALAIFVSVSPVLTT